MSSRNVAKFRATIKDVQSFAELLTHITGPILCAVLPAIDMGGDEGVACRGSNVIHKLADHPSIVGVDASGTELIAFQAATGGGR